jgi:hypothetical protein
MAVSHVDQAGGLFAGAGDDHALAEQRFLLEPAELVVQRADAAHDDDGRGLPVARLGLFGHVFQVGHEGGLVAAGAPAHEGHRGVGGPPVFHEILRDHGQVAHAHVEDQGGVGPAVDFPVVAGLGLGRVLVAGDEADRGGEIAVGDRDARVGGGSHARGDAGHDLEVDARLDQLLALLAPAPEDVRIAALEAADDEAGPGLLHDQVVDLVLGQGVVPALLAHVQDLAIRLAPLQEVGVGQVVVDHDVAGLDDLLGAQGQHARIARTGSDEEYVCHLFLRLCAVTPVPRLLPYRVPSLPRGSSQSDPPLGKRRTARS